MSLDEIHTLQSASSEHSIYLNCPTSSNYYIKIQKISKLESVTIIMRIPMLNLKLLFGRREREREQISETQIQNVNNEKS
jgi:hypothetical protein